MSLPAVNGNTIAASDLYQLCQPSAGQEKGKYFLAGSVYANGALVSQYMASQNRVSIPVSLSIDTADQTPTGGMSATPNTSLLGANGVQVWTLTTTGPNVNARCGGNLTLNF